MTSREAFESIIETVPAFQPRWQKFLSDWADSELPWYLAMGELAHYVVDEYEQGTTTEFEGLFASVESVYRKGGSEIQNLIWVGLFEDIQNIASHRVFGSGVFRPWLGPRSRTAWDAAESGMPTVAEWAAGQPRRGTFDPDAALATVENPELRKII